MGLVSEICFFFERVPFLSRGKKCAITVYLDQDGAVITEPDKLVQAALHFLHIDAGPVKPTMTLLAINHKAAAEPCLRDTLDFTL